jgi:ribonuclease G
LSELDLPEGMGLICRTVGEGRKDVFFKRDLEMLMELWEKVENTLVKPKAPALVYKEPTLLERTVRDFLTEDIDEIVVDTEEAHSFFREAFRKFVGNDFDTKVVLHKRAEPIFERYKVASRCRTSSSASCSCPRAATSASTKPRRS